LRILIITTDPNKSGGVANYYKTLSGNFSQNVEYFIMGSRTDKDGVYADIRRIISDYKKFREQVKASSYDVIVFNPTLDLKAVLRDGRFIQIAHKYSKAKLIVFWRGFYLDFFDKYIKRRFKNRFAKTFFKADAHIVLGAVFKDKLRSIGCTSPIFSETTIVGNDFVRTEPKVFPAGRHNILFLARVEKDKGIYEAIDTLKILKEKFTDATLTVAGNGFELENAKRYVANNNIPGVVFLGDVRGEKKIQAFDDADVYLFPSYYEGMPNSVLEAMGMGLPVVTRNVGGLPDFFVNGEMGFITDSFSPVVLADSVMKLFSDIALCEQVSKTNILFAKDNFLMEVVIKRLESIFNAIHTGK
jgi:glycosyltransferase involved in cell wall biosynthesis